ncbi:caspase family protein [Massilia sp. SM-13]|uniref:caspase family protein n=1 Tax=Pseudoduganella rhizocola TaxID=3382643 RepID=UPI0038B6917F
MQDLRFLYKTRYEKSRALVIGINRYKNASPLSFAVNDAEAVRDALVEHLSFDLEDIVLLTDTAATKANILKTYLDLADAHVGLDDRVIVFFAGHGHTRTGIRGEIGFLVPYDADLGDMSTFIRWDELTRNAELIRAKHILFIMDACYGGLALTRAAKAGTARFLNDMLHRTARQVLTAGKADEVVADSGGPLPDHSVFTGHLLEGLGGKAATPDGIITASSLMSYVYNKVSSDKNSHQTPHYGYFEGDGDMILLAPDQQYSAAEGTVVLDRLVTIPYADIGEELTSTSAKLNRAKKLLASETGAIQLHDMLIEEVRKYLAATTDEEFALNDAYAEEELLSRLDHYESAVKDISITLACTAYWGKSSHITTLQKCLARATDRFSAGSGTQFWLALRFYPLIQMLYATGIAAVDGNNYLSLAAIFNAPAIEANHSGKTVGLGAFAADAILSLNRANVFEQVPGHERNYTPLSEYLFKRLQPLLDDAFFLGQSYESSFDRFEIMFALVTVDARLVADDGVWAPIGRFGWKSRRHTSPVAEIVNEFTAQKEDWPPLRAGLFGGSYERAATAFTEFQAFIARLRWH